MKAAIVIVTKYLPYVLRYAPILIDIIKNIGKAKEVVGESKKLIEECKKDVSDNDAVGAMAKKIDDLIDLEAIAKKVVSIK